MGKIKCFICKKRCEGSVLKVKENKFIHRKCFRCSVCKVTLETGGYFKKDDKFFCRTHYLDKFGVKCCLCLHYAEGEVMVFLGQAFHLSCFKCSKCQLVLRRGEKVAKWNGEFFCARCFIQDRRDNNMTPPQQDFVQSESIIDPAMTRSVISAIVSDDHATSTPDKAPALVYRRDQYETQSDTEECSSSNLLSESNTPNHHGDPALPSNQNSIAGFVNKSHSLTSLPQNCQRPVGSPLYPTMSFLHLKQRENQIIDHRAQFRPNRVRFPSTDPRPYHFHIPEESTPETPVSIISNNNNNNSNNKKDYSKFKSPILSNQILQNHVKMNIMKTVEINPSNHNLDPISASRSPGANVEIQGLVPATQFRPLISTLSKTSTIDGTNSESTTHSKSINVVTPNNSAPQRSSSIDCHSSIALNSPINYKYFLPKDFLNHVPPPRSVSLNNIIDKTIPYNQLVTDSIRRRRDIDIFSLDKYLSNDEFSKLFQMSRETFYHLPEWKRNDLKRRVGLF